MPSELNEIFTTEFTLPARDRRRFDGLTAGFTDEIDSYHVEVNVADDDKHDSDDFSKAFAWERGAANFDPMSEEEYQKADFYACDGPRRGGRRNADRRDVALFFASAVVCAPCAP